MLLHGQAANFLNTPRRYYLLLASDFHFSVFADHDKNVLRSELLALPKFSLVSSYLSLYEAY